MISSETFESGLFSSHVNTGGCNFPTHFMQNEPEEIDGDPFYYCINEEDTLSARNMAARIGAYSKRDMPICMVLIIEDKNVDNDCLFLASNMCADNHDNEGCSIAQDMLLMTEGERYFACVHKYEY